MFVQAVPNWLILLKIALIKRTQKIYTADNYSRQTKLFCGYEFLKEVRCALSHNPGFKLIEVSLKNDIHNSSYNCPLHLYNCSCLLDQVTVSYLISECMLGLIKWLAKFFSVKVSVVYI